MQRSFVCPDLEENEEESEDEVETCFDSECKTQAEDHNNTGLTVSTNLREIAAKIFLKTTKEKLHDLKSSQKTSYPNKKINNSKGKITNIGHRKRKVDIGELEGNETRKSPKSQTVSKPEEIAIKETKPVDEENIMSISAMVTKVSKRKGAQVTNKVVLEHLTEQDFKIEALYDPHGAKRSRIEKDLDEAIAEHDFELAQKISDEISERQLSEKISNNFKACSYLEKQRIEKEAMEKRKKKLTWMFDHKERWELKGNM